MIAFTLSPKDARFHDAFVIFVPPVTGKEALLLELSSRLRFPLQFGMNWDALHDILCDPYWLEARRVIIVHGECPRLTQDEFAIYAGILRSAMSPPPGATRRSHEEIDVLFPLEAHEIVQRAIDDSIRRDEDSARAPTVEAPPSRGT